MVFETVRGYRPLNSTGGSFLSGPRLIKILTFVGFAFFVVVITSYLFSDEEGAIDDTDNFIGPTHSNPTKPTPTPTTSGDKKPPSTEFLDIPAADENENETLDDDLEDNDLTNESPKGPSEDDLEDDLEDNPTNESPKDPSEDDLEDNNPTNESPEDPSEDDLEDNNPTNESPKDPSEDDLETNIPEDDGVVVPQEETLDEYEEFVEPLVCTLPLKLVIPKPEDASYAPPPAHSSVLEVMSLLPTDEQQSYCEQWNQVVKATKVDRYIYNTEGECGNWQEDYIELHRQGLESFEKTKRGEFEDSAKFAVYMCNDVAKSGHRGCGGLADRMSGMISTFFYSLLTKRTYFSYWSPTNPFPLQRLFDSPFIDWRYDPDGFDAVFDNKSPQTTYKDVVTLNAKLDGMDKIYFKDGPTTQWETMWNETVANNPLPSTSSFSRLLPRQLLRVVSNRAIILHTFARSTVYLPKLTGMGLNPENTFGCLTDFLFRPTLGARQFIDVYKNVFELDTVFTVGIQVRLLLLLLLLLLLFGVVVVMVVAVVRRR
ncbi:hypothetical protein BC938DRAFT_474049 [Jimgerdemannia flammicorona]|uniref:Uncharacterized protein n=1 Tax=Jimgerdemannia flammicorona TaxID=994334 RepID=A0A433QSU2_9FUNG|nr:hypothetical protein BC938DRAFT_474049 [Jimgerdemannia flammicorona]